MACSQTEARSWSRILCSCVSNMAGVTARVVRPRAAVQLAEPLLHARGQAELVGLRDIFVDAPERVGPAWDEAPADDRPVVLEVRTDPNVPPLPPHVTLAQARAFTATLLKGNPDQGSVLVNTAAEVLASVLHDVGRES